MHPMSMSSHVVYQWSRSPVLYKHPWAKQGSLPWHPKITFDEGENAEMTWDESVGICKHANCYTYIVYIYIYEMHLFPWLPSVCHLDACMFVAWRVAAVNMFGMMCSITNFHHHSWLKGLNGDPIKSVKNGERVSPLSMNFKLVMCFCSSPKKITMHNAWISATLHGAFVSIYISKDPLGSCILEPASIYLWNI